MINQHIHFEKYVSYAYEENMMVCKSWGMVDEDDGACRGGQIYLFD